MSSKTLSLSNINSAIRQLPPAYENRGMEICIKVPTRLENFRELRMEVIPQDQTIDLDCIVFKSILYVTMGHKSYEWELVSWE